MESENGSRFCISCGAKIDIDTQFCSKCGVNQNGNVAQMQHTYNRPNKVSNLICTIKEYLKEDEENKYSKFALVGLAICVFSFLNLGSTGVRSLIFSNIVSRQGYINIIFRLFSILVYLTQFAFSVLGTILSAIAIKSCKDKKAKGIEIAFVSMLLGMISVFYNFIFLIYDIPIMFRI